MNYLRKSNILDDWFVIDNPEGTIPEGTKNEWLQIINGIENKEFIYFKRVSFNIDGSSISFYSPRNFHYPETDYIIISKTDIIDWIIKAKHTLNDA